MRTEDNAPSPAHTRHGFSVASFLICLFGDSGVFAYRKLDCYRHDLAANVERLQARNVALTEELANLKDSPERNLVLARGIGLYRPGDEVVRLEGLPPRSHTTRSATFSG